MTLYSTTVGTASSLGRRPRNEDRGFAQPPWVFLLDGVGGSEASAEAAQLGLASLLASTADIVDPEISPQELQRIVATAHAAVLEGTGGLGMSTLTLAHLRPLPSRMVSVQFCWVGDSPAWLVSEGSQPVQILPDGEASGGLLRDALGWSPLRLHCCAATLVGDGRIVLASDGLLALPQAVRDELMVSRELTAQSCATSLVEGAINAGGSDNTTAVVIDVNRRSMTLSHTLLASPEQPL